MANNTVENNRIKEILGKNVMRLQLAVMKYNKENGDATAAENLLAGLEGHYAAEDAEFDRINPDYRVPEIPDISKLNEIQIKEKIQINMEENPTAKSEKVAPPEISNPNKSLG